MTHYSGLGQVSPSMRLRQDPTTREFETSLDLLKLASGSTQVSLLTLLQGVDSPECSR